MALDPDIILDRRLLKRRVTRWRTAALGAIAASVYLLFGPDLEKMFAGDHVALLGIEGVIVGDDATIKALEEAKNDDRTRALIIQIDSPGGTTYGGEALFEAIREVGQRKPVIAVIGTLGTSAGYLIALASDRILARTSSLTGSIGVLMETVEVSRLLDKIGVSTDTIKSGPYKDTPSPLQPMTKQGRAVVQALIDDSYGWFVGLVATRRNLPLEEARSLADGRVYTGRQALEAKLIDQLGAVREARSWLEATHGISTNLPLRPIALPTPSESAVERLLGIAKKTLFSERLRLDGLISVWHPDR